MIKDTIIIILLFCSLPLFGQSKDEEIKDTVALTVKIGLRGNWQTGNLNQWSITPSVYTDLANQYFYTQLDISYAYLYTEGFVPLNDFWVNGLFQYKPQKRFYPAINLINGYAKSYKIKYSSFNGLGLGLNLKKKKEQNYIQAHILTGYMNIQFENESTVPAFSLGSLIRLQLSIKSIIIKWELSTYHSTAEGKNWGGGNLFQIDFLIGKGFFLNLTHKFFYNNIEIHEIEKSNSILLFGINYSINRLYSK